MTVFAKRRVNVTQSHAVQDRIGELQLTFVGQSDLMMFSRDTDDNSLQDVFVGLPSKDLLTAFPGFIEIERAKLPEYLITLVVREDGFADRFPDIARKRNASQRYR